MTDQTTIEQPDAADAPPADSIPAGDPWTPRLPLTRDDPFPRPLAVPRLRPTPQLPDSVAAYNRPGAEQPPADPLGVRALPGTRRELNQLLLDLCRRLISACGGFLSGRRLVAEMNVQDERALRLLVAYGHVYHQLRQIVGLPGTGYCWGDLARDPADLYRQVANQAHRMGRCFLFNAALYGRRPAAVEMIQLILPLAESAAGQRGDELAALLSARGVGTEQLVDAMISIVGGTAGGRDILQRVAQRHQGVLLPARAAAQLASALRDALSVLDAQWPVRYATAKLVAPAAHPVPVRAPMTTAAHADDMSDIKPDTPS